MARGTTGRPRRDFPPSGRRPHRGEGGERHLEGGPKGRRPGGKGGGGLLPTLFPVSLLLFSPSPPRCGGLGLAGNVLRFMARS